MLSIIKNYKIYIYTLAGLLAIIGELMLLLLPDFKTYSFIVLTFTYILWCIAYVIYLKTTNHTNIYHMRIAAGLVFLLFYASQLVSLIYKLNLENKEKDKETNEVKEKETNEVKEKETNEVKEIFETSSMSALLSASIMYLLSIVYPKYSKNYCYGLIGYLTLIIASIVIIFKHLKQHLSFAIGFILLIIQLWINNF